MRTESADPAVLADARALIQARLTANRLPFDFALTERLSIYLAMLESWNQRMDLTAVLPREEAVDRHFVDSLSVLPTGLLEGAKTLVDVGTGAGFPGLVLAMACPEKRFALLDAQQKRLSFLEAVCAATETRNVSLYHLRAEDGGRRKDLRESFDVAVARAVAPLNVLCELLLPFVRPGGRMIAWKGPALSDEMAAGDRAARLLGGALEPALCCPIDGRDWDHRLLPIRKVRPTPASYPRRAGLPKASPLGQKTVERK